MGDRPARTTAGPRRGRPRRLLGRIRADSSDPRTDRRRGDGSGVRPSPAPRRRPDRRAAPGLRRACGSGQSPGRGRAPPPADVGRCRTLADPPGRGGRRDARRGVWRVVGWLAGTGLAALVAHASGAPTGAIVLHSALSPWGVAGAAAVAVAAGAVLLLTVLTPSVTAARRSVSLLDAAAIAAVVAIAIALARGRVTTTDLGRDGGAATMLLLLPGLVRLRRRCRLRPTAATGTARPGARDPTPCRAGAHRCPLARPQSRPRRDRGVVPRRRSRPDPVRAHVRGDARARPRRPGTVRSADVVRRA